MLDIITLVSQSTPAHYVTQCILSIQLAANLAGYAVNQIQSPGVAGHIGHAIMQALACCRGKYVAFVDDDDFVLPNAFECLAPHFASNPAAICARELQQVVETGLLIPNHERHHLSAYSRAVIDSIQFEQLPAFIPPALQTAALSRGNIIDVMQWVYVYRRRHSAGYDIRRTFPTRQSVR